MTTRLHFLGANRQVTGSKYCLETERAKLTAIHASRRNIFLGRMFVGRLGILGIISGAFGAYRRDAIQRLQGSFRDGFVPAHVRQTTWH